MKALLADLHVHTVLSPCAEVEMIPPLLVQRALDLGLGLMAVTDHNGTANCGAVMAAAAGTGLAVLPGIEVQTREDVHVLCLFDVLEQALAWQEIVSARLPPRPNPAAVLGPQFVVDARGEYVRTEGQLLLTGADLALEEVVAGVRELGGLCIPAHIDRPAFGLLANLGLVPPGLPVPALEVFRHTSPASVVAAHPELRAWPLIQNSDAHQLDQMRAMLRLRLAAATIAELALALGGQCGRQCDLAGGRASR